MNQINEHFKQPGDLGMNTPNSHFKSGGDLGMNTPNSYFKPGGDLGMDAPNSYFKPGGDLGMDAPNSYFKQPGDLGMGAQNSYFQSGRKDENIETEVSDGYVSWDDDYELKEAGSMAVAPEKYQKMIADGNIKILKCQEVGPFVLVDYEIYAKKGRTR